MLCPAGIGAGEGEAQNVGLRLPNTEDQAVLTARTMTPEEREETAMVAVAGACRVRHGHAPGRGQCDRRAAPSALRIFLILACLILACLP